MLALQLRDAESGHKSVQALLTALSSVLGAEHAPVKDSDGRVRGAHGQVVRPDRVQGDGRHGAAAGDQDVLGGKKNLNLYLTPKLMMHNMPDLEFQL